MNSAKVLELFTRSNALLNGHFQLSSGLHSPGYLQCARVLQHPEHAATLGVAVADRVRAWAPNVVLSPALGGVIIGHEVARALGVRALFIERHEGRLLLRRGFELQQGERVVVVEDVVTTGRSTRETIDVTRSGNGETVGAVSVINRGGTGVRVGVPFEFLASVSWPTYDQSECPLCADGVPITKPGSRPTP